MMFYEKKESMWQERDEDKRKIKAMGSQVGEFCVSCKI